MRFIVATILLVMTAAIPARAQARPETLVLLRTATDRGAYHYVEVIHERGTWIPFDVGHIDFDHPALYREMWIGGGGVPINTPKATLIAEGFVDRAFGRHGENAMYAQPFFIGVYRVTSRVLAESAYLGFIPLNDAARVQHLLERAKLEYDFPRFKVGAGYGAYKYGDAAWSHKPFITATLKAGRLGNFEAWLQRVEGDHVTVQVRYAKLWRH